MKTCQDPQRLVLLSWPFPLLYLVPHFVHNKGLRAPCMLREMGSATLKEIELLLDVGSTSLVYPESNLVLCRISEKLLKGFAVIARRTTSDGHILRPALWSPGTRTWCAPTLNHGDEASNNGNDGIAFDIT